MLTVIRAIMDCAFSLSRKVLDVIGDLVCWCHDFSAALPRCSECRSKAKLEGGGLGLSTVTSCQARLCFAFMSTPTALL